MEVTEHVLEQASALLATISGVPTLDDARLVRVLELVEDVGRLVDGLRVNTAAEVADRSRHELGSDGLSFRLGQRRPQHLIEQFTRVSGAEAARRMRLGALVRTRFALDHSPLPPLYSAVAEALSRGSIGTDAAAQITTHLQQAAERCAPDDLFEAERRLVDRAVVESADLVGMNARLWRDFLDADGAEPRDDELRKRAEIHLGRERDGMTPIYGQADPVSAAKLKAMFNAYLAPRAKVRFVDENGNLVDCPESARNGSGPPVCGAPTDLAGPDRTPADRTEQLPPDTRTVGQRRFDILIRVITAGLTADTAVPRSKSTIVATIRAEDYNSGRGVGYLDGIDEPVSAASVQALGCDTDVRLLVLGTRGEILALGHGARLFNYAQRVALAVRDGGCIWPQCTAPPSWCEAHHVIPHGGGTFGPTDTANGVLLCSAHHHALHHSDMTLVMESGVPRFIPPERFQMDGRTWAAGSSRVSRVLRQ